MPKAFRSLQTPITSEGHHKVTFVHFKILRKGSFSPFLRQIITDVEYTNVRIALNNIQALQVSADVEYE